MRRHSPRPLATLAVLAAAVALTAAIPAAQAAPPANDAFAAALPIAGESGSVSGTNVEATKEPGEPNHADDPGGRSVWYRWTAPATGSFAFDTCGADFDTLLAVHTGTAVAALREVASNDDVCGLQSLVFLSATAGTAYSIAVDGFRDAEDGSVETGAFTLRWRPLRATNDNLSAAEPLTGASGMVVGTNIGATAEPGEPSVEDSVGASVWYRWTSPITGPATFDTCGSSFDTVLAAFTGATVTALTRVAANDDADLVDCELQSRIRFGARAGTEYTILVDGFGEQPTGGIALSWSVVVPPPNDDVRNARRISGIRGSVPASNRGADSEPNEPAHAHFTATSSVWFRWRAPRTMGIRFDTCRATFDTVLAVYRGGSPRASSLVTADDDSCGAFGSRVNFVARRGVEYRIAVDGVFDETGEFVLAWGRPGADARCVVPDVRRNTVKQATARIDGAGCRVGRIVSSRTARVPRGRVISQLPPPGRRVRFLSRVTLVVSR